jgi:hypothetical protein
MKLFRGASLGLENCLGQSHKTIGVQIAGCRLLIRLIELGGVMFECCAVLHHPPVQSREQVLRQSQPTF